MDYDSDAAASEQVKDDNDEIDDREEIAPKYSKGKKLSVKDTKLAATLAQQFGGIPGVPVGAKWGSRKDCSEASVHRPPMAGIHGTQRTGAFSIVVSCHYRDDKDYGDTIYYTGTGGRKRWTDTIPPKRIRLGPQVFDQLWTDQGNEALVTSRDTGNPVRVVRSHKVLSDFAPAEGYRYDGLYTVESAWKEKNPQGLDICRYRLERVPGQPPLPRRSLGYTARQPSPASVATSDTIVSPSVMSISRKRKTRSFAPQGDPPIYADVASKKYKLANRPPPQPFSSSSSSSAAQPHVLASVLVTIQSQTPLQRYNQRVQTEMQQHFSGTSVKRTPAKRQPWGTLLRSSMLSGPSQANSTPARPMLRISYHEDDEDADDEVVDDEDAGMLHDDEDMTLEDLETMPSPFSSFLSPSPFSESPSQL
ncbi:PUA-like domain-containing protein [Suillus clintonianus]|uniref:PUA-like domain-containing protein n=1 Tax=Suillus clintonianus TaxID=1904413 RepID=UPI001B884E33|nr:PUA-like domain-containing protein [Suillus clintonianus]KAG2147633.1 PUA-like domain-containing protein [Suillus clintonianus]